MEQKRQYIEVEKGVSLYVETCGLSSHEPCLFISGAGANSSFWTKRLCLELLERGFFVIKYDHRDFGYSSKIDWEKNPYGFMWLVEDARSILDALELPKAHVIGHSMGGFIVQLLGIHYPERVISLTSISSSTNSPEVPSPPDKTWEVYLANKPSNHLEHDLPGFLEVWKYLNGTASFDEDLAIAYTQALYERQVVDGALGASHVKAQQTLSDRTEALRQVKAPALVMHGEEDYAVDKYGGIQTAASIKGALLLLIPKMGHLPFNQELLRRFEDEIIGFLCSNRLGNAS